MGKPNNVIDIKIARALKEAGLKPTAEIMAEALDRIGEFPIGGVPENAPKEKKTIFFKDYPLVEKVLGCERASKLFSRLEYRFNIMPDGFYKFMAPCKNRAYRKGDSLCEEMNNVCRDTVWRALKKIVTQYPSKNLYETAKAELGETGVFQGMPFLSYFDNNTHQTFYLRNKKVVDLLLEGKNPFKNQTCRMSEKVKNQTCGMSENQTSACLEIRHAAPLEAAVYKASAPPTKNTYKEYSLSISLSGENSGSEERTENESREREIKKVILEEQPLLKTDNASQMFKIWVEHMGPMNGLSPKKSLLEECLQGQFNGSLEEWEGYCKMVAKSKFLMGESGKGNFKAFLGWAIKPENIEDVLSGNVYDQDRSNSSNIIPDREKITEEEEKEILSLDIPENVRELRLRLLRVMGGASYRSWMKKCLIDEIGGHSVDFKPEGKFHTGYVALHYKDHILKAVGDMFQNVTIQNVAIDLKPFLREKKVAETLVETTPPKIQTPVALTEKPVNPVVNKKWEESIRMELLKRVGGKKENS